MTSAMALPVEAATIQAKGNSFVAVRGTALSFYVILAHSLCTIDLHIFVLFTRHLSFFAPLIRVVFLYTCDHDAFEIFEKSH